MKVTWRLRITSTIVASILFLYLFSAHASIRRVDNSSPRTSQVADEISSSMFNVPVALQFDKWIGHEQKTKLQLISIWNGNTSTRYLSAHMQSMKHLDGMARLLFVNRDLGYGCIEFDEAVPSNVEVLCIDNAKFSSLIVNYLCDENHWNCSEEQDRAVMEDVSAKLDPKNMKWRALFGQIFAPCVRSFEYWGWSDMDVIFGDLNKLPIYALDGTFDVITMDFGGKDSVNIYSRGQVTIIHGSEKMDRLWTKQVSDLTSPEAFLKGYPLAPTEERYWSVKFHDVMDTNWLSFANVQSADDTFFQIKEELKSVQIGLDIIHVPLNFTRRDTIAAFSEPQLHYPATFSHSDEVVDLRSTCPDHWITQETDARCLPPSSRKNLLFSARHDGKISRTYADSDIKSEHSYRRQFIQHFHILKRRKWFHMPTSFDENEVYEWSLHHSASYRKDDQKSTICNINPDSGREYLCPGGIK